MAERRRAVESGAELDEEPVLFARSMGRERDRTLVAAHPDRRAWLLTVESHQREHLEPFAEEAGR